jgi:hypothetical protein
MRASEADDSEGADAYVDAMWPAIQRLRRRKRARSARAIAQVIIFGRRLKLGEQGEPDPEVPFTFGTLQKAIAKRLRRGGSDEVVETVDRERVTTAPARPVVPASASAPAPAPDLFSPERFRAKVLPKDIDPKEPIDLRQFNRGRNAAMEKF